MKNLVVGVDPGKKGGICFLDYEKGRVVYLDTLPSTPRETAKLFKKYEKRVKLVVLEKQWARPRQGVVSTFTLANCYGVLQGILASLNLPYVTPAPTSWLCFFFGKDGLKGRKVVKKLSLEKARELHPYVEAKHDGHSDALLIAEFGRALLLDEKLKKKYVQNENRNRRSSKKEKKRSKTLS